MAILSNVKHYIQLVVTWSLKMNITINLTKVNTHDNNGSMLQMNWTKTSFLTFHNNYKLNFDINAFSQMKRLQPRVIEFSQ